MNKYASFVGPKTRVLTELVWRRVEADSIHAVGRDRSMSGNNVAAVIEVVRNLHRLTKSVK